MLYRLVIMIICLAPAVALAQIGEPPEEGSQIGSIVVAILLPILSAISGASFISALVSSNKWWMTIIDAVALNWLKARNDPGSQ